MAQWKITADHISTGVKTEVGSGVGSKTALMVHKFRLYDDDDVLYYEGVCSDDSSFDPLDWAETDAGCTRIDYQNADGTWSTL